MDKEGKAVGWLVEYFNLSPHGNVISGGGAPIPLGWQLALYVMLILGILANGYLAAVRAKRRYRFRWRQFLVGAIIGLAIFPAIYEGAQANLGSPGFVQLALVFASGLGYESLFAGIVTLAEAGMKKK
jgi:hypothetical protein